MSTDAVAESKFSTPIIVTSQSVLRSIINMFALLIIIYRGSSWNCRVLSNLPAQVGTTTNSYRQRIGLFVATCCVGNTAHTMGGGVAGPGLGTCLLSVQACSIVV